MPRPKLPKRTCAHCGKLFTPTNAKQIYHSEACRAAAYRWRKRTDAPKSDLTKQLMETLVDPDLLWLM